MHVVPDALKHRCLDVLNDLENSDVNTLLATPGCSKIETDFDRRAKIRQLTSDIPGLQDEKERVGDAPPPSKTQALAREVLEALSWGGGKSPQKFYLSFLLPRLDSFRLMTPYCYLESVYDNPHEITVPVSHSEYERIPRQTVRQVMRDLLPGTWNGRTIPSGGGYYNASRVGGTGLEKFEHAHPNIYHVKLDSNPLRDEGDVTQIASTDQIANPHHGL